MSAISPTSIATLPQGPSGLERMSNREAAEAFEGYMTELMVREMRRTVPEGMLGSQATKMFSGIFDEEISRRIAGRGSMGLADQIERALDGPSAPPQVDSASMIRGVPMPIHGRLTSAFGVREDPFGRGTRKHRGIDLAAAKGTPIQAVRSGRVVVAGQRRGFGNVVVIRHPDGLQTTYAHCDHLDVQAGQEVRQGEPIATVGETGRATGPHLHFEARVNGHAVDPMRVFGWQR